MLEKLVDKLSYELNCYNPNKVINYDLKDEEYIRLQDRFRNILKELLGDKL